MLYVRAFDELDFVAMLPDRPARLCVQRDDMFVLVATVHGKETSVRRDDTCVTVP